MKSHTTCSVRPFFLLVLSALTLLVGTVPAFALPQMTVQIGNESFQVQESLWSFDAASDTFSLNGPFTATASDGSTFRIDSASAVQDPLLLFSASATNNSAGPLAYSFAFNTSLLPNLLGPVASHAELGVTLTDGLSNGATVQPAFPANTMLSSFDLYSDGTPISKNVDIGSLFHILSGTSGTTYSADSSLVCSQACVTMSAILSFTLTGQDAVGFSGRVVQTPVPLPAAGWLFATGAAALMRGARRMTAVQA